MTFPDLTRMTVTDAAVGRAVNGGRLDEAQRLAADTLADALVAFAVTDIAAGRHEDALRRLQEAVNLAPAHRYAFHNLVAALLDRKLLRAENLQMMEQRILRSWDSVPWARQYRHLLYQPTFLNLQFVSGKCNLKCRMCEGVHHPGHANKLSYLEPEMFRAMVRSAPTIGGLTLSSGDSDPLLHPQWDEIVRIAAEYSVSLDVYTNGHPLSPRSARLMVESRVLNMINFSIDAASPAAYRRIRGSDLSRVVKKIEMLQALKAELQRDRPWVSLSFVAMADNIDELPDFVSLAQRLGAGRVMVGDMSGWDNIPSDNRVATEHPDWYSFVTEAKRRAVAAGINLQLPERFLHPPQPRSPAPVPTNAGGTTSPDAGSGTESAAQPEVSPATGAQADAAPTERLRCCSWLNGAWVSREGALQPCCWVQNVADMGNVQDGPLHQNQKYLRVKDLLFEGKVFDACVGKRMCPYVQQQDAAGIPLRIVTREELAELAPRRRRAPTRLQSPATTSKESALVELPVLI
jgi:MoaA/NifB/PqqE/SkfB family radical SAM enzyme